MKKDRSGPSRGPSGSKKSTPRSKPVRSGTSASRTVKPSRSKVSPSGLSRRKAKKPAAGSGPKERPVFEKPPADPGTKRRPMSDQGPAGPGYGITEEDVEAARDYPTGAGGDVLRQAFQRSGFGCCGSITSLVWLTVIAFLTVLIILVSKCAGC